MRGPQRARAFFCLPLNNAGHRDTGHNGKSVPGVAEKGISSLTEAGSFAILFKSGNLLIYRNKANIRRNDLWKR